MTDRVKVFFDGGCRPNPGMMEIAVVVAGQVHIERDLGHGTSEDAEWLALIAALRTAQTMGLPDFVLIGDAAAVIGPATGKVRPRGGAVRHWEAFRAMVEAGHLPKIRHVGRSQNLAGIALAALHPR